MRAMLRSWMLCWCTTPLHSTLTSRADGVPAPEAVSIRGNGIAIVDVAGIGCFRSETVHLPS